ncbi:conserved hypothetical protein, partial [Ricinus communis]
HQRAPALLLLGAREAHGGHHQAAHHEQQQHHQRAVHHGRGRVRPGHHHRRHAGRPGRDRHADEVARVGAPHVHIEARQPQRAAGDEEEAGDAAQA